MKVSVEIGRQSARRSRVSRSRAPEFAAWRRTRTRPCDEAGWTIDVRRAFERGIPVPSAVGLAVLDRCRSSVPAPRVPRLPPRRGSGVHRPSIAAKGGHCESSRTQGTVRVLERRPFRGGRWCPRTVRASNASSPSALDRWLRRAVVSVDPDAMPRRKKWIGHDERSLRDRASLAAPLILGPLGASGKVSTRARNTL